MSHRLFRNPWWRSSAGDNCFDYLVQRDGSQSSIQGRTGAAASVGVAVMECGLLSLSRLLAAPLEHDSRTHREKVPLIGASLIAFYGHRTLSGKDVPRAVSPQAGAEFGPDPGSI